MVYSIGQIVYSISGRDKAKSFIVTKVDGQYVYIADGDLRKLDKPKKKKIKHIQATNFVDETIKQKIENNEYLLDADIRKALKAVCDIE